MPTSRSIHPLWPTRSPPPRASSGLVSRRSKSASQARSSPATSTTAQPSLAAAEPHRPLATSAGSDHAHPNGVHPARAASEPTRSAALGVRLTASMPIATVTPDRLASTATIPAALSRNRRPPINPPNPVVTTRASTTLVSTPRTAPIRAAIAGSAPVAQKTTDASAMRTVATPGTPTRLDATSPGSNSRARKGNSAKRPGSRVSSIPEASSGTRVHPSVSAERPTTTTSGPTATPVKRSAIIPTTASATRNNPYAVASTTPTIRQALWRNALRSSLSLSPTRTATT